MLSTSVLPKVNAFNENINAYLMNGVYNILLDFSFIQYIWNNSETFGFYQPYTFKPAVMYIYCSRNRIILNAKYNVTLIG